MRWMVQPPQVAIQSQSLAQRLNFWLGYHGPCLTRYNIITYVADVWFNHHLDVWHLCRQASFVEIKRWPGFMPPKLAS